MLELYLTVVFAISCIYPFLHGAKPRSESADEYYILLDQMIAITRVTAIAIFWPIGIPALLAYRLGERYRPTVDSAKRNSEVDLDIHIGV